MIQKEGGTVMLLCKYAGNGLIAMFNSLRLVLIAYVALVLVEATVLWLIEDWSFYDSLWFTRVTALTIGYGDMSPQTATGRALVSVCSHIQILLVAPAIVARLLGLAMRDSSAWTHSEQEGLMGTLANCATALGLTPGEQPDDTSFARAVKEERNDSPITSLLVRMVGSLRLVAAIYVGMLLVTSLVLTLVEHWSFGGSVWFSQVTALTIGYGDMSPQTVIGREVALLFGHACILLLIPSVIAHVLMSVIRNRGEWTDKEQTYTLGLVRGIADKLGVTSDSQPVND